LVIPAYWTTPAAAVLWQVTLHSTVAAAILMVWVRQLRLPCGPARQRILAVILVLPLLTAVMPGRRGFEFRERTAWLDSLRLLEIPLAGSVHLYHLVLALAAATVLVSLWQEVPPLFRRPRPEAGEPPAEVVRKVRSLPGWRRCRVHLAAQPGIFAALVGLPSRPQVVISKGAVEALAGDELEAVLRHENAHAHPRRWIATHLLYAVRCLQLFNPVALWAFREYMVETEIACDADAVAGRDPRPLARVLLRVYDGTDTGDVSARSLLRRRVDVLLGRVERAEEALSPISVLAAAAALLLLLPWIV
jgi:hypothetical protein